MKLVSIKAKRCGDVFYLDGVEDAIVKLDQEDEIVMMFEGYLHRKVDDNNFYYLLDIEHEHKDVYKDDELNQIYPTLLSTYLSYIRGCKINMLIN